MITGFDGDTQKDEIYRFVTSKVDRKYWAITAVYTMNKKFKNGTCLNMQAPIQRTLLLINNLIYAGNKFDNIFALAAFYLIAYAVICQILG